jgi:hypothetical protein
MRSHRGCQKWQNDLAENDRSTSPFLSVNGVILHCGRQVLPMGDRITAVPINALWS